MRCARLLTGRASACMLQHPAPCCSKLRGGAMTDASCFRARSVMKLKPVDKESRMLVDWMEKGAYDAICAPTKDANALLELQTLACCSSRFALTSSVAQLMATSRPSPSSSQLTRTGPILSRSTGSSSTTRMVGPHLSFPSICRLHCKALHLIAQHDGRARTRCQDSSQGVHLARFALSPRSHAPPQGP